MMINTKVMFTLQITDMFQSAVVVVIYPLVYYIARGKVAV